MPLRRLGGSVLLAESSHNKTCAVFKYDPINAVPTTLCVMSVTAISEYPSPAEAAVVRAAEQFMEETMCNFSDPSHDPHHGQ